MKIHNIRYGFATNSSSSHSVVLSPGLRDSETINGLGFGWENFILASPEAKRRYLFAAAFLHYREDFKDNSEKAATLARDAFPVSDEDFLTAVGDPDDRWSSGCYIDHQSHPEFPRPRNERTGMGPLWSLLENEIVQASNVAIIGGNDNQDNEEWKPTQAQYAPEIALWRDLIHCRNSVYAVDDRNGHIVIFNRGSGKKTRVLPESIAAPRFSVVPELVDVKITDYCPVGCDYCYQGSTIKGKHADLAEIEEFARTIGDMGVFEVAIGGGDPTTHPHFTKILKAFFDNGVVPNFSTQMWDWLKKPDVVEAVKAYCGAVALSTQNPKQANEFIRACDDNGIRPHIHYVMGLSPLSNLKEMLALQTDGFRHIVLLAYKEMGRAEGRPPIDYSGWQDVVRQTSRWTIAVDSFLVREVEDGFTREEVPQHLFENGDGRFSLYWDAVEGTYASHSFKPQSDRLIYGPGSARQVADAWRQITKSLPTSAR